MSVRIALAQFVGGTSVQDNLVRIEGLMTQAARAEADVIAFHELATTTYFCFDDRNANHFKLAEPIPGPATDRVAQTADELGISVVLPMYEAAGLAYYNSAVFIEPQTGIGGVYHKSHVPASRDRLDEPGAEENFYFSPGQTGFVVWDSALGIRIGVLICYDRHFQEAARCYALQGVDVIFAPTASYRPFIVDTLWEAELQAMAFQNSCYVAGINKIGPVIGDRIGSRNLRYPGKSAAMDPEGALLAKASDQPGLVYFDCEPRRARQSRDTLRFSEFRRPELYGALVDPSTIPHKP